jgi:iron(III) transport system substrate-binding protein
MHRRLTGGAVLVPLLMLTACGGSPSASADRPGAGSDDGGVESILADFAEMPDGERLAALIEQAEAEGELSLYTSNTDMQEIVDAFMDEYDIEVAIYQAIGETVLQRLLQEAQADFHAADVVEVDGSTLDIASAEGLLAPYETPLRENVSGLSELPEDWSPDRLNVFTVAWNEDGVPSGSEPASFEELAEPEWDGRLALELGNFDWLLGLYDYYVGEQGWTEERFDEVMRGIADDAKVVKGHTVMGELLSAGEFDVAVGIYSHTIDKAAEKDAPVAWRTADGSAIEPVVVRANGVGVMREAAHPAAAALFTEYLLTGGQQMLLDATRVPAIPPAGSPDPFDDVEATGIPSDELLQNRQEWSERYTALLEGTVPVS